MIGADDITGLILCGGAGSRFGSRDKPLEDLGGSPLVAHVRQRLLPQVRRIVISCNRNHETYRRWGDATVTDEWPDQGPLAGILACVDLADTDHVFVCPGDAPFLPATLVERLTGGLSRDGADIAIPHDGSRRQHLFMLLRRILAPALRDYLATGGRSVHAFVDSARHVVVDCADQARGFVNVNSPADLLAADALQSRTQRSR
jgi:molybdopterin-guanine dinucleotide biosynthesis protein A